MSMYTIKRHQVLYWALTVLFCGSFLLEAGAQSRRTYTAIQAGGLFGLHSTSDQSPMHGYQIQFSFGRNFHDRAYAGIGLSQDIYRGTSVMPDGKRSTRRTNALPIFGELRVPLSNIGMLGSLGSVVNLGYAPPMGADYFGGFVGRAGLSYGHMLADRSDLLFSVGYGFQQFDSRFSEATFSQHNAFISIGLFIR